MARAIVCATCGSKIRADRERCPRCRAVLQRPDPARAAAESRQLARIAGIIAGVFALVLAALWFMREPAPAPRAARPAGDPLAARRTQADAAPVRPDADGRVPFLESAGAAHLSYAAGDYVSALAQYQAAIGKNPQDAEALSNLGQVLVRLNRPAEAIPYYQRAIAILPDRWTYQFNLARALSLVGRTDESVATYRRAQQLFPDDYVTTFNLALTLHKAGDDAAAIEQYQKAIALQPDDASFRMALANSYERLRKPGEAVAAYQEYLRLAPAAPDADKVRARIAELSGTQGSAQKAQGGL
jgi:tetratricopeptide (TPR) repeat protein